MWKFSTFHSKIQSVNASLLERSKAFLSAKRYNRSSFLLIYMNVPLAFSTVSWPFVTVSWPFVTVSWPFVTFLKPETVIKRSWMVRVIFVFFYNLKGGILFKKSSLKPFFKVILAVYRTDLSSGLSYSIPSSMLLTTKHTFKIRRWSQILSQDLFNFKNKDFRLFNTLPPFFVYKK